MSKNQVKRKRTGCDIRNTIRALARIQREQIKSFGELAKAIHLLRCDIGRLHDRREG
jgi:hypothetical protein